MTSSSEWDRNAPAKLDDSVWQEDCHCSNRIRFSLDPAGRLPRVLIAVVDSMALDRNFSGATPAAPVRRGFALVVTLSLLVLLTLLAVGLLSLAAVQLRASSHGEAEAVARANARMAMWLALADLQAALGPDERISAPAAHTLPERQAVGHPHALWTGVYRAWDADDGHAKRPEPRFVGWLASAPDRARLRERNHAAATTDGEVSMVGKGTLRQLQAALTDRVTVPGIGLRTPAGNGRMAWWTADESTKAPLAAGRQGPAPAANAQAQPLIAANAGVRPQGAALAIPVRNGGSSKNPAGLLSPRQLAVESPLAEALIHDVTTCSLGLPVDVTRGRFKLDFSSLALLDRSRVANLPLYKADGAVNQFTVANGRLANDARFARFGSGPTAMLWMFGDAQHQPGIHLEELWTHANLYRVLQWNGGVPELRLMAGAESRSTDFRHRALSDPWFNYAKPVFASVQFVLSFVARPDPAAAGKYRMLLQMDALAKVWNPNNVRVVIPPGSSFVVQLLAVPFKVQWQITTAKGDTIARPQSGLGNNTYGFTRGNWTSSSNKFGQTSFNWLRGNIGGLAQKGVSTGYTLEPGECRIFGHDKDTDSTAWSGDNNVNLSPGWGPGRQALIVADFGANNLAADDVVEFVVTPDDTAEPRSGVRTYCNKWIGHRAPGAMSQGGNGGLALGATSLPLSVDFASPDPAFFPPIRSSQRLRVSQYLQPKPFMVFGHYLNAEQPAGGTRDAFASAARILTNSQVVTRRFRNLDPDNLTAYQEVWRSDPLPLSYDSALIDINARDQGRFGGGHNALTGVTRCATRQLDAAPPLSLMSLSHAPANGFADRFAQASERASMGLDVLQSDGLEGNYKFEGGDIAFSTVTHAAPQVERAVGNAFATPFVPVARVTGSGMYHPASGRAVPLFDHSYLANAALFDAWFCSSLHDGMRIPASAPYADPRGVAQVLGDFFTASASDPDKRLFNPRVLPATRDWERLKDQLLNGNALRTEAVARIGAHLLLDGPFNVNSTRKEAWKAMLATSREQARKVNGSLLSLTEKTPAGSSGLSAAGPAGPAHTPSEPNQWSGFRVLDDDQIDALAEQIAREVARRGPFLSLADFLNRRPGGSGGEVLLGTVQAAIEACGLNAAFKGPNRRVAVADFGRLPGSVAASAGGGLARATGIPGYLMQSDVLAPFANGLTPRGDTFRIRAYGAATDAAGRVTAEAWCEAVFQRTAEYLDPADPPETARAELARPLNRSFGRRFMLQSFQWLPRTAI